ncbi:Ubiquinone/menaquinone biosynthesis C-methyltransferase UbiE [Bordetella sputigena]|uniref:class I SAM-dependent methyltransferase n=1 Tax=Bordetella sputigena TaxID=1416810 RepID=UPI0039F01568
MQSKHHWEHVYASKSPMAVSWYQPHAAMSLDLIEHVGGGRDTAIIDVGGGASTLVEDLDQRGYRDLTVLDLSGEALALARDRMGPRAARVRWIEADITTAALPAQGYDLWHDRAVFHFLTKDADRRAYVRQVMRAVKPGGHVIVATFSPDGPAECSGLPVVRYDADALHGEFGAAFQLIEHRNEAHVTPGGRVQHFVYCHCIKPH